MFIIIIFEKSVEFILRSISDEIIEIEDFFKWIIQVILYFILLWNAYKIVLSHEVMYSNYWLMIGTIFVLIALSKLKSIHKIIIDENIENKKWRIIGQIFMIAISSVLFFYSIDGLLVEKKVINVSNLYVPTSLSIEKYEYVSSEGYTFKTYNKTKSSYEIKNKETLEKLISELNNKQIENLRGFDLLDYMIKKSNYNKYYTFKLYQSELENAKRNNDIEIDNISLYEDGTIVLKIFDRESWESQEYKTRIPSQLVNKLILTK